MRSLLAALLLASPIACGPSTPPAEPRVAPEPPKPAAVEASAAPAPSAEPQKAPEPTAEEKKKAADAKQLAEDRATMEAEARLEAGRWTPELRAAAKKLAETKQPSLKAALKAALEGKHREPGNPERDKYRHPLETLELFGMKPNMTVFEYGPGEGWFTELLAPVLAPSGKLVVNTADPNGPADARPTLYAQRLALFLGKSPELFGKVERVVVDPKKPDLGLDGKLDMAIVMRGMHGWHRDKMMQVWLAEIHDALKPGGVLGIEQHRAKADANPDESTKQGYLPEAWLIKEVESAGFKLAAKSEINANPKDTKDYPEGVWSLPPTLRQKDKDRQKYLDIGESDRMTLKFVKVDKKK